MLSWDDYEDTPTSSPADQAVVGAAVQQTLEAQEAKAAAER